MKLQTKKACGFIKKESLAQVFSSEFCEISNNSIFTEHLWATASVNCTFSKSLTNNQANQLEPYNQGVKVWITTKYIKKKKTGFT